MPLDEYYENVQSSMGKPLNVSNYYFNIVILTSYKVISDVGYVLLYTFPFH